MSGRDYFQIQNSIHRLLQTMDAGDATGMKHEVSTGSHDVDRHGGPLRRARKRALESRAHAHSSVACVAKPMHQCNPSPSPTHTDCAGFADLFTEDGTLEVKLTKSTSQGHAQLRQWCNMIHQKFRECSHWEGNVVIEEAEEGMATNFSYWKVYKGAGADACVGVLPAVYF